MKKYFYLILMIGFCFPKLMKAQIKLDVQSNKTTIEVGEVVEIDFIVTGNKQFDLGNITFPNINNAQLLGSREQTNFSYRNGESIFNKIISFVLRGQKEGKIIIPPVTVEINDKKYTSNRLSIQVVEAKEVKALNKDKSIFLDVQLSETTVYNQQPIVATFKLYSLSYDALRRRSDLKNPSLKDFQVKKISNNKQRDFNQELIGDRVYISEEVGKYQLIPQKSGELIIPPFGLTLELLMGYNDTRLVDITSDKVKVDVKSLPANAPKNFTGAVGDFKINTYVDKKYLQANETFQLEVELIGSGNLSSLQMPKLNLNEDLEVYEPLRRNKFQSTQNGEKGKVVNTYAIVPQYGGNYTIPSIEFSFFNPKTKTYQNIQSTPIELAIEGEPKPEKTFNNPVVNADSLQNTPNNRGDSIAVTEEGEDKSILNIDLPEIKKTTVKEFNNSIEKNWVYLLISGGLILLSILLFFLFKKRNKKPENSNLLKTELTDLNQSVKNKEIDKSVQKAEQILDQLQLQLNENGASMEPLVKARYEKVKKEIQLYRYASETPTFSLKELYSDINYIVTESLK